jgi:hypothetical protein
MTDEEIGKVDMYPVARSAVGQVQFDLFVHREDDTINELYALTLLYWPMGSSVVRLSREQAEQLFSLLGKALYGQE